MMMYELDRLYFYLTTPQKREELLFIVVKIKKFHAQCKGLVMGWVTLPQGKVT